MNAINEWIKTVPSSLLFEKEVPLLGFPPPFSLEAFAKQLSETFQIPSLELTASHWKTKPKEKLSEEIGTDFCLFSVVIHPLEGPVFWVMPKNSLESLFSLILTKTQTDLSLDPHFFQGLRTFFAMEVIQSFKKIFADPTLDFHLQQNPLPQEEMLSLEISASLYQQTFYGTFLLSQEFLKSWKEKYSKRNLNSFLKSPLLSKIEVALHVNAGKTSLLPKEITSLKPGDFILLDQHSIQPGEEQNKVTLTIKDIPVFQGRLKRGRLKILDYPSYQEELHPMTDDFFNDNQELTPSQAAKKILQSPPLQPALTDEAEPPLAAPPISQEQKEEKEVVFNEEEPSEEPLNEEEKKAAQEALKAPPIDKKISMEDLPVSVVIEVGRLQMTLQKLLDLKAGNILDTSFHPEEGVDLVVNGRKVAKGELLKVGDRIGVRILDI